MQRARVWTPGSRKQPLLARARRVPELVAACMSGAFEGSGRGASGAPMRGCRGADRLRCGDRCAGRPWRNERWARPVSSGGSLRPERPSARVCLGVPGYRATEVWESGGRGAAAPGHRGSGCRRSGGCMPVVEDVAHRWRECAGRDPRRTMRVCRLRRRPYAGRGGRAHSAVSLPEPPRSVVRAAWLLRRTRRASVAGGCTRLSRR